jgi:hypothetical protein
VLKDVGRITFRALTIFHFNLLWANERYSYYKNIGTEAPWIV